MCEMDFKLAPSFLYDLCPDYFLKDLVTVSVLLGIFANHTLVLTGIKKIVSLLVNLTVEQSSIRVT